MKTGPVRDAQQTKQCVYSIPCDCDRCYIGETSRLLEVRIKEHKYNLMQGLLEKSNLDNMHTRKATKYVGMKQGSCRLSPAPLTGNTRN
jgi:predicted GIY-YIG superfamily endonuclease